MTDASFTGIPLVRRNAANTVKDLPLPKPQPIGAPVFLADCVTPLAGETVLSLLMKRMMQDHEER